MRLDPAIIKRQIDNLFVECPELHEDDQLRADMIEGSTDAEEFLRMIERSRQSTAALAGALVATITENELRLARFERREQAYRKLIFRIMEAADLKKWELPEATISIRNGSPKVIVTDEKVLPDAVCRFRREPDKTKIKSWIESGQSVPGAVLSNPEPALSIRTK